MLDAVVFITSVELTTGTNPVGSHTGGLYTIKKYMKFLKDFSSLMGLFTILTREGTG